MHLARIARTSFCLSVTIAKALEPKQRPAGFQTHQFPVGTRCFSSSNQFSTTVTVEAGSSGSTLQTNRCPSVVTSYSWPILDTRLPPKPSHIWKSAVLITGEAVKQAVAARAPQIFLAAASAGVRRVPRRYTWSAALAVMMAEHGSACAAAGSVLAGVVFAIGISRAV